MRDGSECVWSIDLWGKTGPNDVVFIESLLSVNWGQLHLHLAYQGR